MRLSEIIDSLRKNGYWKSPTTFPCAQDYLTYIKRQDAYNGHVVATGDGIPRTLENALEQKTGTNCGYASHTMEAAMCGPGLLHFLLPFTSLAEEYFEGEEPLLYSINAFWKKAFADSDWHFDQDDRKIFVMFMYGSDILKREDGPHGYIRGSHHWSDDMKDWFHKSKVQPDEGRVQYFYGPAGTYFFTDTRGLHNGIRPAPDKPARLLIWARWGVTRPHPKSYEWDKLAPVPESKFAFEERPDSTMRQLTKLVIGWNT